MHHIRIEVDQDGIALVTFDVQGRSMNTLLASVRDEMADLINRLREDDTIKGVILASGKANGFFAGADLVEMEGEIASWVAARTEAELSCAVDSSSSLSRLFRAIETLGKPVACSIEGLALGGGLELALCCHYRVVADDPKIRLGLPEATIGLFPGAGGTQRLPRLVGIEKSLPMLLQGKPVPPAAALAMGFVDAIAPKGKVVAAARLWLLEVGDPVAAWDKKGFTVPGGGPYSSAGMQLMAGANAMLRGQSFGNYPAQEQILKAVFEGTQLPMTAALRVETRRFLNTVRSSQAAAMVRTNFHSMQAVGKGAGRPDSAEAFVVNKAAVLGAGMMGAGIAYVQAVAGIETVLIDVDQNAADRGLQYSLDLLGKDVARGRMTQDKADAIASRITATTDYALIAAADIVIEAVFENRELKAEVTRKAEVHLGPDAVFGSNTSTLPIDSLADASSRPENFIGIHFFSPVDKMQLVELISGARTSTATLAKAFDYVMRIRKVPIAVNDSRGFYTSRVFGTYIAEGMEMLAAGIAPAIIDNVGRMVSMPRGPIELCDDVGIDLVYKVDLQTAADLGEGYVVKKQDAIVRSMVEAHGRYGRKNKAGFYDYPDTGSKRLWPGLGDVVPVTRPVSTESETAELKERLLYRQAIEAARCFDEGVISDPREADVGALLAWGFPAWTGGPISYINDIGIDHFVTRADELAKLHGPRFVPPDLLREMARDGRNFFAASISLVA